MQTVIYYFSGTGNNLAIAQKLANLLGNTDILPIRHLLDHKTIPSEYTWVGFCTPSYYSHVPPFVQECMENLIFTNEQKIFTIVGCGGNRGLAHLDMRKQIEAASKKVQLEYMISLPGSYILSYSAFPDVYSKLTTSFSYKKIEQIAKAIQSDSDPISLKTGMFYTASREAELQKNIASYNEVCQGYTISNSCKHCGICAKVCPTQNITLQNGQVSFGENCQQCMACIQWCPQRAIDYKGKASSRKRYHHINISLKDMTQYNA